MKVTFGLNPEKYSGKERDWQDWQKKFIDFNPSEETWFHRLKAGLIPYTNPQGEKILSAKTCPSFVSSFKNRILVRNIADLEISNVNDTIKITSSHPYGEELHVNYHHEYQLGKDFPFDKNVFKNPVKFISPFWMYFSEKAEVILSPVWYDKSTQFVQALPGIIRLEKNEPVELNINTFVKQPEKNTTYTIEKGTPICQVFIVDIKKPKVYFTNNIDKKIVAKRMSSLFENMATLKSINIGKFITR